MCKDLEIHVIFLFLPFSFTTIDKILLRNLRLYSEDKFRV